MPKLSRRARAVCVFAFVVTSRRANRDARLDRARVTLASTSQDSLARARGMRAVDLSFVVQPTLKSAPRLRATSERWRRARARASPREGAASSSSSSDSCVTTRDLVDTSLKFAYAWAAFGYVVPSAALAAMVDADDLGASLAVVQLSCESAKAAATVRVLDEIDRGVGSLSSSDDDGFVARGAAFGGVAVVLARAVDGLVSTTSTVDAVAAADAPTSLIAHAGPFAASCAVVASCVVAPALEELFFRGFLCEDIRRRTSNAALAIGVSSAIFALAHFSLPDVPSLFACGVVFALASQSRGGVRSAFVAHALFNSSVLIERAAVARAIVDAS